MVGSLGASDKLTSRMAELGYASSLNKIFVIVLVSFLGFLVLAYLLPVEGWVLPLALAPATYPLWRFVVFVANGTRDTVKRLNPAAFTKGGGCGRHLLFLPLTLLWVIGFTAVSLVAMLVHFGLDIPLRFASEKAIGPVLLRFYRWAASKEVYEKRFHFRTRVLFGLVCLLLGFFYQFLGVVLSL